MNKRLYKEISRLTIEQNNKPLLDNDYLIYLDECNTDKVYAIIKAPYDSVYRHKFIRLNFNIPKEYPYKPPIVTLKTYMDKIIVLNSEKKDTNDKKIKALKKLKKLLM